MTPPRFHGSKPPRGQSNVPRSDLPEGLYGRLFRSLPPAPYDVEDAADRALLLALGETTVEPPEPDPPGPQIQPGGWGRRTEPDPSTGAPALDNKLIPAGYTYVGQFLDHDVTFDPTSQLQRQNDPDALQNFRTPRADLDSVYGRGPDDEPYLYERDGVDAGVKLRVSSLVVNPGELDLPRIDPERGAQPKGRAAIGDPRNDENVIVSQLHLGIIRFHNAVVDLLRSQGVPEGQLFEAARRHVRFHYQWALLHDFLPRIVSTVVVDDILRVGTNGKAWKMPDGQQASRPDIRLLFYRWASTPYVPVEFSTAAYRFGHSMVRPSYRLNSRIKDPVALFDSSGGPSLVGFRPRDRRATIDWSNFFEIDGSQPQLSRRIDHRMADPLRALPFAHDVPSLAVRNLLRGASMQLASGQSVARAMGVPEEFVLGGEQIITEDDLRSHLEGGDDLDEEGFATQLARVQNETPLWYYVLREADVHANGQTLGPVGGRIVAEVIIGLLHGDKESFLNQTPGFRPDPELGASEGPPVPAAAGGAASTFRFGDLLRFAGAHRPQCELVIHSVDAANERVVLENMTTERVALRGWSLRIESQKKVVELPEGAEVLAGQQLVLEMGEGVDGDGRAFLGRAPGMIRNSGDSVVLINASGVQGDVCDVESAAP